jgi:serine/threonine protein kinase
VNRPEFPALPTGLACPAEVERLVRRMLEKDPKQRVNMHDVVRSPALHAADPHSSLDRLVGFNSKLDSQATQSANPVSISKVEGDSKLPSSKHIAEVKNQPNSTTSLDLHAHKNIPERNL